MAEENGQHVAENGSRWHGALLSCALTVPRMIEEAMIGELGEKMPFSKAL